MKQFRNRSLISLLLAFAMLAALLPVPALAEEAHVHDHTKLVNGVCTCGARIAATVTIGDNTTCYEDLELAFAAAEEGTAEEPATIKLQRTWQEVKGQGELPTFGIRVLTGVFTLDFNGGTIFSRAEHILQIGDPAGEPSDAVVTITDSSESGRGRITGSKNLCAIYKYGGSLTVQKLNVDVFHESSTSMAIYNELGDLTVHGGSFKVLGVEYEESYALRMDSGTTNRINGGSFTGGDYDIYAAGDLRFGLHPVSGVGATFPDGISVLNKTLSGLPVEGAAYWTSDAMLTDIAEDADSILDQGDITVKTTCDHSGNTATEYRNDGLGTHSIFCSVCGYIADSQAHSGGTATCTEKAECSLCGAEYGAALGHSYGGAVFTWADDCSAATAEITCGRCDENTQGHTLSADAVVTRGDHVEGTCTVRESTDFTATAVLNGQEYREEKTLLGDYGPHELTHVEAVAPSCEEPGNSEYYACSLCGKYFSDADATVEVKEYSWIEEALGHDYEDGTCTRCGEEDPDWEEPSQPTDPEPTDPEPTDPEPTDPEPTDPEPTDPVDPVQAEVVRLAGKDRYLTGFAVADYLKDILNVDKFDAVVIAYGQNFPDALTGSYLAAVKHAPILLTEESRDADVLVYLQQNLTSGGQVYILGGTAAVSQSFEEGASQLGFQVKRLKGANRYETNLAILEEAGVAAGDEILIATGGNYADSLSASATGLPMLLVSDALTEDQKAFLEGTSGNFVILGGAGAVSEELEAALKEIGNVTRVKGSSRYGTSVAIAQRYFENPAAAVLAYAEGFPDGLCGGPLAMAMGAPLILTSDDNFDLADTYVVNIRTGAVTGGSARISDETVREIFDLADEVAIPKA